MGRTVSEPTPHNESMSTSRYGGLWGEVGPAFSWREFMTSYYRGKKPADWTHPAEVSSMTLCKLSGQPAPAEVSADLAVTDLVVTPDPAAPRAACGAAPASPDPNASPPPPADTGG